MISVQNVSKRYRLYDRPFDRVLEALPFAKAGRRARDFWAVRDVSFRVGKGEVVAIIGPNGSGKSTLLQIASGILQPTTGRVITDGRIAALLELGAGFNPEFTGRENVLLNGEIMGLSRREIDEAFPNIEAFAEIGDYMQRPVKEYSTGMYVRLAFSTAIHVRPDVLIVDEALAVGDAIFSSRCVRKFEELRERGVTVLLVSHDLGLVKRLADRAIFMLEGRAVLEGTPNDAVNRYVGYVLARESAGSAAAAPDAADAAKFRHGDGASRIVDIAVLDDSGARVSTFSVGDHITVRVRAEFHRAVDQPVVGVLIRNRIGMDVFGTNTRIEQMDLGMFEPGELLEVEFQLDCLLSRGEYTLTIATQYRDGRSQDWLDDAASFTVADARDVAGVLNLHTRVRHRRVTGLSAPAR